MRKKNTAYISWADIYPLLSLGKAFDLHFSHSPVPFFSHKSIPWAEGNFFFACVRSVDGNLPVCHPLSCSLGEDVKKKRQESSSDHWLFFIKFVPGLKGRDQQGEKENDLVILLPTTCTSPL